MKTVVKELSYEKVLALKTQKSQKPVRPGVFWRWLMRLLGKGELAATNFTARYIGMEKLGEREPCLILMNHSCFTDLLIAQTVFARRPMNIVCTSDGFVGKNWLMRHLGCIPTNKFVTDFVLVRNMKYALDKLHTSILMYPEASYSFDGTATPLPATLGKCLKLLGVPVVMVRTYGAFARDPLYNNLQKRKVNISADIKYLLSPEDIKNKTVDELNQVLRSEFTFDNWKWQRDNNVKITEPFRADYLNRVLYKCRSCGCEGKMSGKGITLTCSNCGLQWTLREDGQLEQNDTKEIYQVPDWFRWEREQVRSELTAGTYCIDTPVEIYMMVNTKAIYHVGQGTLQHTNKGFVLDGCDGKLHYEQGPRASYSLYSDYYWYEIGDMICIGDMKTLYYCFPKKIGDIVAKARIATEELYKMNLTSN
jgi:1-acyl-sn-glycerol-3-phosphate acyltransferase